MKSNKISQSLDDKEIKGLHHLLDTKSLQHSLQQVIPGITILSLQKHYIRYKPETSILVRYHMVTAEGSYDLYAKSYNPEKSKMDNSKKRSTAPIIGNVGHLLFPQHHTEVYFFPNDARLRHIQRLLGKQSRASLLKSVLKNRSGNKAFRESTISTLQYKPERRYVACLTTSNGKKSVLKAYRPRAYEQTLAHLKQLQSQGIERFPTLIGQHEKYQVLIFKWREGEVLSEYWQTSNFNIGLLKKLARQLADFHQGSWQQVIEPRKNNLSAILQGLSYLTPHLHNNAQLLGEALQEKLQQIPDRQARCHGDFYAKQILVKNNKLYWLDLDDICLAHPGRDLATFVAHLEWDVLRGRLSAKQAKDYEKVFINGYQKAVPDPLERQELNSLIALHLFKLIHHPFRSCEKNWVKQTELLLNQIARRLHKHTPAVQRKKNYSVGAVNTLIENSFADKLDEKLKPLLASAINPVLCLQWFKKYITEYHVISIKHIKVIRYKAGKRVLVEYRLMIDSGEITLMGKIRAKGLHRSIYRINHQLHEQRHTLIDHAGWQVPPPLCMIPECNMWLQQHVPGIEFSQLLKDTEQAKVIAKQVAKMSYSLHHSGLKTDKLHSIVQELEVLRYQLYDVAENKPQWKTAIFKLYNQLSQYQKPLLHRPSCCIHRDFYPDQVMINKNKLYLLDLDLFCMGDPCLDIGNFVAHIEEQALRDKGDMTAYQAVTKSLVQHYLQLSGNKREDVEAIESYRLLSLARHISISQRLQGRTYLTPKIINILLKKVIND